MRLAKLHIENNPEFAKQLSVSSIPTVFAVWNGRLIDKFVGALEDNELQQFVDGILRKAGSTKYFLQIYILISLSVTKMVQMGEQLIKEGKIQEAASLFKQLFDAKHLKAEAVAIAGKQMHFK